MASVLPRQALRQVAHDGVPRPELLLDVGQFAAGVLEEEAARDEVEESEQVQSRLRFFLRGYLTRPKTIEEYRRSGNFYNYHNSPLTITLLDLIFAVNDLEVRQILRDEVKTGQLLLAPLVYLLKLVALCSPEKARRKHGYALTLRNDVVLGGNTLIFITRKKAAAS